MYTQQTKWEVGGHLPGIILTGSNDKSRTNTMTDTASMEHGLSFSLYVERLFLFRLKAFTFASLIYHLSSRIAICNTELDGTTDRDVFGQLLDKS